MLQLGEALVDVGAPLSVRQILIQPVVGEATPEEYHTINISDCNFGILPPSGRAVIQMARLNVLTFHDQS